MHIPTTRTKNPMSWRKWKTCQPMPRDTPQMTRVLTESRTIRVVALISLVTEMPAKLKKAIETIVIKNAPDREKVLESQSPNLRFTSQWDEWMIVQPTLLQRQIIYEIICEHEERYRLTPDIFENTLFFSEKAYNICFKSRVLRQKGSFFAISAANFKSTN